MPQVIIPTALNRYVGITAFQRMPQGLKLKLDRHTYVIREANRYVAYRHWMNFFDLVEIFDLGQESALAHWLENHGFSFNHFAQG